MKVKEIVNTGGLKELHITTEDRVRWETTSTTSSRNFKKELMFYKKHPYFFWLKYNWGKIVLIIITFILLIVFYYTKILNTPASSFTL